MARSVPAWVGKSDDHRAPQKVRLRVFDRVGGKCHLCGQPIQTGQKWDLDHVVALINGGENVESNLHPAHRKCHKDKTAADVAEKARIAGIRAKHIGAHVAPKQKIRSAGFPKSPKQRVEKTPVPRQAWLYRPSNNPEVHDAD